jgi:hypothetical protein
VKCVVRESALTLVHVGPLVLMHSVVLAPRLAITGSTWSAFAHDVAAGRRTGQPIDPVALCAISLGSGKFRTDLGGQLGGKHRVSR